LPRNIDIYVFRKWSKLLSVLAWKHGGFGFPFGILLPLGLFALVCKWRNIPVPLKLFIVLYPASIIIVFASARYRIPIIPVLAVLAGEGILYLISLFKNKKWILAVVSCICGTAITLFLSFQGPFVQEQGNFEAELYANAASTTSMQGNSEKTITYLQKALSLKEDYPFAHANFGAELTKLGRFNEAIPHLQNALKFKEDSPEVYNNMASAFAGIGKIEQAKNFYKKALEIKPNYAQAYYNMGNMLLKHRELSGAISYLEQAIKYKQNYAKAYSDLGIAHTQNGHTDKAIVYFAEAVRIEPENTSFRTNLVTALSVLENAHEIVDEYCQSTDFEKSLILIRLAYSLENLKTADFGNPKYMIFAQKAFELIGIDLDETTNTPLEFYSSALLAAKKSIELSNSIKQENLVSLFKKQAIYFESRLMENKKSVP
jgi:tetratricopeptide (TPR) repeat protein